VEELGKRGVHDAAAALEDRRRVLVAAGGRLTRDASRQLDADEARLRALDPRRVLERGYSITRDEDGRVRKGVQGLTPADVLHTELARGSITSRVEAVQQPGDEDERE
jgi:exodeoxyribonuclease VII large subunit